MLFTKHQTFISRFWSLVIVCKIITNIKTPCKILITLNKTRGHHSVLQRHKHSVACSLSMQALPHRDDMDGWYLLWKFVSIQKRGLSSVGFHCCSRKTDSTSENLLFCSVRKLRTGQVLWVTLRGTSYCYICGSLKMIYAMENYIPNCAKKASKSTLPILIVLVFMSIILMQRNSSYTSSRIARGK